MKDEVERMKERPAVLKADSNRDGQRDGRDKEKA
jgi:hypothetical protein